MDSYVNSLGNFAAGEAGRAGRGRAGRTGGWHTGCAQQAAPSLHVQLPLHLGHRRPVRAEAWKHERGSQRRGRPCISPRPHPASSESLLLPGPSPAKPDADGGGAVALGVQREPVESRPRPRDAPAPRGRDPGERGLGSGRPGSPDEREEGVTATASAGRRGPQEPWLAPRLSGAGAEARQMPGI